MKRYEAGRNFKLTLLLLYMGIRFLTMYKLISGIVILAIAMIFYFTSGGLKRVMEPPFEDSREYKDCVLWRGYNLKEALQREKDSREIFRKEQKDYWKYMVVGGFVFLLGFSLSFVLMLFSAEFPLITGQFFTVPIEFSGLMLIWHGFVNSNLTNAKSVSETFMINSLPRRIERCTKLIQVLHKRLEMENETENEVEKETENKREDGQEQEAETLQKDAERIAFEKEYERIFGKKWDE